MRRNRSRSALAGGAKRQLRCTIVALAASILLAISSGCSRSNAVAPAGPGIAEPLVVRRVDFEERIVLTGEIDSAKGDVVSTPNVPFWPVTIRWLESDGIEAKKGQKLAELDNTALAGRIDSGRLAVRQGVQTLAQRKAEAGQKSAEAELERERRRVAWEKAKIEAAIPEVLRSRRVHQEKQLALERAAAELEKAKANLSATREGMADELAIAEITLAKARREISNIETTLESLVLRAPRDGVIVISDHPWQGRKLQVGDEVWIGFPIIRFPDLASLDVVAALADVDDGKVRVGDRARIVLDAEPSRPMKGTVTEVGAVAQEPARQSSRRVFRVRVSIDEKDPSLLRPGLSARVEVIRRAVPNALVASRGAIDLDSKPPNARRKGGQEVPISLGPCSAVDCVVLEGLREGDELEPRPSFVGREKV